MKMSTIDSSPLFNIISFALLIIGGQAAVILDNEANTKDVTSVGGIELTNTNLDRSQIGAIKQFSKSKKIIHETPESRLVLEDINDDYANNDLISQQVSKSQTKVTPDGINVMQSQSAQAEQLQHKINQQTYKVDKETARSNLKMHDYTKVENRKINGAYADLIENISLKSNGEGEASVENRQGDYASEDSIKSNTFLLNYIPKTSTGKELYAEMETITHGEGSYSSNDHSSKINLKITPEEGSKIYAISVSHKDDK